jgi:D-beta-D-heptose 7-phosphate kinase/D-beta-D-heptose 1-phosphate adenosyltransferase
MTAILDRLSQQTILVVGDVMLDQFLIGAVDRISPEAPVPVVRFVREEFRLGGAANVAANLRALGTSVELVALVGADAEAARLKEELERAGVGTQGLVTDPTRRTTRKTRVVTTRNQQVARIDYEDDGTPDADVSAALIDAVYQLAKRSSAILISDYQKGVITPEVAAAAIQRARGRGIPVTVDPKVAHASYYAGATLITPNHHEAAAITHTVIRGDGDVAACARRLREMTRCDNVLITRGEHGMTLHTPAGDTAFPAEAREVADVTGAGDTVIATLTAALAAGAALEDAARLANRAAGIAVGRFGPATVRADELR